MLVAGQQAVLSIKNSNFRRINSTYGSVLHLAGNSNATITNTIMQDLSATSDGGAAYIRDNSSLSVINSTIQGSQAQYAAGLLCHDDSTLDDTPGPGAYSLPSSFGQQGVAFTMGAKPAATAAAAAAGKAAAEDMPGPGTYYNPRAGSAGGPAFSMAGRWRQHGQEAAAPGPGEHQQLQFIVDGPAFSIRGKPDAATAAAGRAAGSSSPGPGSYQTNPAWGRSVSPSAPAYSMAGRLPQPGTKARSSSPGPAEYQQTAFKPDGPAFSFPAKPKARRLSASVGADTPGPTDYDTSTSVNTLGKSAPAYTIAPKRWPELQQQQQELLPGPGQYYVAAVGPAGPAFSMAGKLGDDARQQREAAKQPAPGDYHTELPGTGHAFTIAARVPSPSAAQQPGSELAGPGAYYNPAAEAALQASKAYSFGARLAPPAGAAAGADSPGPASYAVPEEGGGPAYTIGGKLRSTDVSSDSPGPASYAVPPSIPSGPCFTMGTRPPDKDAAAAGCEGPAVGDYDVVDPGGMAVSGPAWTMGGRLAAADAEARTADQPGPGQYAVDASGPSGPAWSMGARLPQPGLAGNGAADGAGPGPGEYYNEDGAAARGPAFSMAGRSAQDSAAAAAADIPGPGAYLAADYLDPAVHAAPAFSMGTKLTDSSSAADNASPGPGAFQLPELPRGPCYSMAGRAAAAAGDAAADGLPGPGAYGVAEAAAAVTGAAPAWTMGVRLKESDKGDQTAAPAPGDYDPANPAAVAAPAWTIAGKPADTSKGLIEAALLPGPGCYSPLDPVKQGAGVAFSMAGRWPDAAAAQQEEGPAPGAYELPAGPTGAAFTMAAKSAAPDAAAAAAASLPGPGQYHQPTPAGSGVPAYTMAPRLPDSTGTAAADADPSPGPGAYEQAGALAAVTAAAPAYTMAGRPADAAGGLGSADADVPGVGQYDAHLVEVHLGPAAPAFSMAGRLVEPQREADGPCCVDYDAASALAGTTPSAPAFTMAGRLPDAAAAGTDSVSPAPGYYHSPATAGPPPHAPSAPAFSLQGKAKKGSSRLRQMLGRLADLGEVLATQCGIHVFVVACVVVCDAFSLQGKANKGSSRLRQMLGKLAKLGEGKAKKGSSRLRQMLGKLADLAWAALAATDGAAPVPSNGASSVPIPISYSTTGVGAAQTRLQLNGAGIKIAIMDSGLNWKHPVFGGCTALGQGKVCRVVKGWDFVGETESGRYRPDGDPMDCLAHEASHGTQVASVAAGDASFFSSRPWRGVAYKAQILAYKVSGSCKAQGSVSTNATLAAIRKASEDGADVLNLSYGDFRSGSYTDMRYANALGSAMQRGALVAIASGNDGAFGPWFTEGGVAARGVLSSAAVDVNIQMSNVALKMEPPLLINGSKKATVDTLPPEMLTSAIAAAMPPLLARYTGLKFPLKIIPAKPINGCLPITNKAELKGHIALVIRGNCTFQAKADAAAAAGAAAVILYHNRSTPWISMAFDEVPPIPIWGVPNQVGLALLKSPGVRLAGAAWSGEQRSSVVVEPAMFSSWGPAATLEMNPSIAAPGSSVHTASSGDAYADVDGTSYSAPFVSDVAGLLGKKAPQQQAAYAAFVSTAKPIAWSKGKGWAQPVARVGAGLIQVDAAIENPTRTEPTHLLLRSNQRSQTLTLSLTNAGVSYPITYKLDHQPAAAVSLKDTWFVSNPEQLLQPLGASVSFVVAGRAASQVVVQPGQKAEVQVTFNLPQQLRDGPNLYSGYITATPVGRATPSNIKLESGQSNMRLSRLTGFTGTLPYRPVPLVVPYQGFSQNYTMLPLLPTPNFAEHADKSRQVLKSLLRVCYTEFARELYSDAAVAGPINQDGYLYQPHVDRCIYNAADPAKQYTLPLQDLKDGNGAIMISAALSRPAVNMQLMLFEADSCKDNSGAKPLGELAWIAPAAAKPPCIGGFKRGKQLGQVWRYMQPSRDYATTLWSYYGTDFDGSVRTRDAKDDKVLSKVAVQPKKQYKFQLLLVGPLAAADKAAGEDYKTWQYDVPGTYSFV
ncbi:hypothetical protein OEZ86_004068 [Tetradesmus obliquus]|nr:hypothetical protein OEZ86_004068 [Tetradesmus obliquus]